jgi:hypothetical protein
MSWIESADIFGREWYGLPLLERCPECGQPDNCGDCSHAVLSVDNVIEMGGTPTHAEQMRLAVEDLVTSIRKKGICCDGDTLDDCCPKWLHESLEETEAMLRGEYK